MKIEYIVTHLICMNVEGAPTHILKSEYTRIWKSIILSMIIYLKLVHDSVVTGNLRVKLSTN